MVRALLAGRKTQTRRIVKLNAAGRVEKGGRNWHVEDGSAVIACPYGAVGDRLWVREGFRIEQRGDRATGERFDVYAYRADSRIRPEFDPLRYKPSIHMPRAASRITLAITEIRCQRLQEISDGDAIAEGIYREGQRWEAEGICATPISAVDAYRSLWDYINGTGSWRQNPWVWVVCFANDGATS
jgi:hypothetical protein